jgi:hypothetical protein
MTSWLPHHRRGSARAGGGVGRRVGQPVRRSVTIALVLGALTQPALAGPGRDARAGDPVPTSADDLSQAADATADIASISGPAPASAAPEPGLQASSNAIELSSLGLDPGSLAFDDKLNIYGFADLGFQASHWTRNVMFVALNAKTFMVGNLNLYLAKNLMAKARALVEVRFTFLPNGSQQLAGSAIDTTALDVTNFSRPSQWGGVVIERAYVEYDLTEHLTVRGGHWLTPYGVWNIDHGSPVVLTTSRPYIIGEQFFPEHQTGLDLFGSHYRDGFQLEYHVTASNGRGGAEAQADQDNKLAFGGRLALATPWGVKLGGSYYRGRYTGLMTIAGTAAETYLEASYGGDAQLDRGRLHVQAEVIAHDRHYTSGQRAASTSGLKPDGRDFGLYVLAGYRFDPLWHVMPYVVYEDYRPIDPFLFVGVRAGTVGLNFRATPSLVFKLQGTRGTFADGAGFFAGQTAYYYNAQASWVF